MPIDGPPSAPYQQIADDIRQQILAGHLPAGAKLPSEAELVAKHHVARATVQSALRLLRTEGWITSRKGAGTYVATDIPTGTSRCPARIELDPAQMAWLDSLPRPAHGLLRVLRCELETGHPGPHAGLGQHSFETQYWVQWTLSASEINPLEMCTAERVVDAGGDEDDNVCLLFAGHAGRHAYGDDRYQ